MYFSTLILLVGSFDL